ncbi:hypothetical protein RND81_11G044500 [Saponaria officinalis]|uniref:Uncharacterized protein n=1 Tax=Saponaria officinalis TaxID=3572 RepID=A0AAW1HI92_SAPOF
MNIDYASAEVLLLLIGDRLTDEYDNDIWQITIHPLNDEYGTQSCKGREFWHARQTFLSSYHFRPHREDDMRKKLSKSVRRLSEVAVEMGLGYCRRSLMKLRKFGGKSYRASLVRTPLLFIRCFMPQ